MRYRYRTYGTCRYDFRPSVVVNCFKEFQSNVLLQSKNDSEQNSVICPSKKLKMSRVKNSVDKKKQSLRE